MPRSVVQIVAVVLLVLQSVVALVPGRMFCLPTWACGEREKVSRVVQHVHGFEQGPAHVSGYSHGHDEATDVTDDGCAAGHDECGCHVHMPMPDDQQMPKDQRAQQAMQDVMTPAEVFVGELKFEPVEMMKRVPRVLDLSAAVELRALKVTRLLV
jgi:hypothetical protein